MSTHSKPFQMYTIYGPCCCCLRLKEIRNLIMLPVRAPVAGTGWGCFVCGLPPDGAVAACCDECVAAGAPIRFACRDHPSKIARIPRDEPTEPFTHDLALHQM